MDITLDFSAPVQDNTTRKSLGRRVSFANNTEVRMFEKNHTNQTFRKRRSSLRYSFAGSEDMDLTTVMTAGNLQNTNSAILEEEFDYDDNNFDDDMEVTEAIHGNLLRKRSLSMGRQPLSQLETNSPVSEADESRSDFSYDSMQSEGASEEQIHTMEFTVPVGQSLRLAEQDEAWLALKLMTHSGNEPSQSDPVSVDSPQRRGNDEMDLDDAMERLMKARSSLPLSTPLEPQVYGQDDTFTSTEDSFESDNDGNKTLNLSQVISRVSMDANNRCSMGYQDSNMDESEVYSNVAGSAPRQSEVHPELRPVSLQKETTPVEHVNRTTVFQPPPPDVEIASTKKSVPYGLFSSTPRTVSPSKSQSIASPSKTFKPKPTFSAAFAPPVSRPSPRKSDNPTTQQSKSVKRRHSEHDDDAEYTVADEPSPAKKQTMAHKWMGIVAPRDESRSPSKSTTTNALANKARPLSPSRKSPFQTAPSTSTTSLDRSSQSQSSGTRRPSGYFAKRKSLAVGFDPPASQDLSTTAPQSPKKSITFGRSSLGSAPADAWQPFDKDSNPEVAEKLFAPSSKSTKIDVVDVRGVTSRTPSPVRRSPPLLPASDYRLPSPEKVPAPTITISPVIETYEAQELSQEIEIDVDATYQWRETVQQADYEEEEIVRKSQLSNSA